MECVRSVRASLGCTSNRGTLYGLIQMGFALTVHSTNGENKQKQYFTKVQRSIAQSILGDT